jgi:nucleoside-diphosphate-sugar epimerase
VSDGVLVTGAGGFLGSAIVRRLVRRLPSFSNGSPVGHVVAVLSPTGSSWRLDELPAGAWSVERVDLSERGTLRELLDRTKPRAIVHAALAQTAFHEIQENDDDPLIAGPIRTLIQGLSRKGARDARGATRFIYAGSAWVLRSGDRLAESAPLDPRSAYARNKARADEMIPRLARSEGVSWINLRLFNTFGRYEHPSRLVPTLVAKLASGAVAELTHGEQVRDFNEVDTMADAFAAALAAPDAAGDALYHIGSGRGTTVRDFALQVAEYVGRPDLVRFGALGTRDDDMPCLVADPSLARARLGWEPDLDLEGRVRSAVEWWRDRLKAEIGA